MRRGARYWRSCAPDSGFRFVRRPALALYNRESDDFVFYEEAKKTVNRQDSLQETRRGIAILCKCGKPARITARSQTLCYNCFDAQDVLLELFGIRPDRRNASITARTPRRLVRNATHEQI